MEVVPSLPPRAPLSPEQEAALYSIEGCVYDFLVQLKAGVWPIVLRTSGNLEDPQMPLTPRSFRKISYNLTTMAQVHKLLSANISSTKRDLFYDLKQVYRKQTVVNNSISSVCNFLKASRLSMNVVGEGIIGFYVQLACEKGLLRGNVCFLSAEGGGMVDCRAQTKLASETLLKMRVIADANFILVVEKDASFQKLLDEQFLSFYNKAIIGKGYPDFCTRKILCQLVEYLRIPVYGLFDADPHGVEIFLTYKYGSARPSVEGGHDICVPSIQWLGIRPSKTTGQPIPVNQYLPLSHTEFKKIETLKRRAYFLRETLVIEELELMRQSRSKLEIEAISSLAPGYLTRNYLLADLGQYRPCVTPMFAIGAVEL